MIVLCTFQYLLVFGSWHDRWCATIVIQHLSNHYPIANGIYIGHFGDNTKSEWARRARARANTHTHLLPCIHVRPILLSVYLLFAWRCYAFFSPSLPLSVALSPPFIICSLVMCALVRSLTTIPTHDSWCVSLAFSACVCVCSIHSVSPALWTNDLVSTVRYNSVHNIALRSETAIRTDCECMCRNLRLCTNALYPHASGCRLLALSFSFIHFLRLRISFFSSMWLQF